MYNFENNAKDGQHHMKSQANGMNHLTKSNQSEFQMTSPNPHDIQSFMTSSGPMSQSPEPHHHQLKQYIANEQLSPSYYNDNNYADVMQGDFKTPHVNHQTAKIQQMNMAAKTNYHVQHHQQESISSQVNGVQSYAYNLQNKNHLNGKSQDYVMQNPHNQHNQQVNAVSSQNLKSTFQHQNQKDMPLQTQQHQQSHYQQQPKNTLQSPQIQHHQQNQIPSHQTNQQNKPQKHSDEQMIIKSLDLDKLRSIMKEQYKQYSDEQIEQYLQKFLKEYLVKVTSQKKQQQNNDLDGMFSSNNQGNNDILSDSESEDESDQDFNDKDFQEEDEHGDPSRDSLNTNLDWNDKGEIEKYCVKQKRIQEKKDFRPSQYFGAIKVDQLADGIDDSRIDELFQDVFGIKPKPKKRIVVKRKESQTLNEQQQQKNSQQMSLMQNQIQNMNNGNLNNNSNNPQNDQSCKIVLNIYNQFQFMNQQDTYQQNQQAQQEDDYAAVLYDKTNQNPKKNNCQILHQEQQIQQLTKQKSMQQEQLKKYMSPAELNKLKHQKTTSESIELENNEFQKCCFKTDDNRAQQVLLSSKGLSSKCYQTQMSSPQSITTINRHLYNQSITSSANLGVNQSIQSLTHQSSHGNLNLTGGLGFSSKNKHSSNLSLNKQAYKSIIYKHHHQNNSNFNSISSQQSLENKPKQNKLSYLVAKNLPDGLNTQQDQQLTNDKIQSVNVAPKPPQNQTLPISQKMGRDSKDSNKQPYNYVPHQENQNCYSENSPQVSPKSTFYNQNSKIAPSINQFKLNTQTFSMQHANQTFQNSKQSMLQKSLTKENEPNSKTLVQQASENFRKAKQSVQLTSNLNIYNDGAASQRTKHQKTLGRNQSQNLFMSQNQINTSVQSFLMSSGEINKNINKEVANSKVQYLDTEEIQVSPKIFCNKYDQAFMSNTSRPQTAINTNFNLATGINQYMNAATNLGKPPSKLQKAGFLSHNTSAKNLKIQTKGNMTVTQTSQNSQRKQRPNQTSVQEEFLAQTMPNSTRNANMVNHTKLTAKALDFTSKERDSIQKPATTKSIDRNKLKSSLIQQQYENDLASIERKRQLIQQHQKQVPPSQGISEQIKQGSAKQGEKKQSQLGRNQSGISKGKSANQVSDFISTYQTNTMRTEAQKPQDSQSRMVLKITKSIEKLQQATKTNASIQKTQTSTNGLSIVSSPTNSHINSKTFNFPQSTKNISSSGKNHINEMMNHLSSYQNYKKNHGTGKIEKENMLSGGTISHTGDLRNMKNQKSSIVSGVSLNVQTSQANSKTRKDNHTEQNMQVKKTTETFKRYLTSGNRQ